MTPRERLLAVLGRQVPDCVPCSPDISNMIPCRLTGKPFWDIYLYNDPPLLDAAIAAQEQLDLDAFIDCFWVQFDDPTPEGPPWETFIVMRAADRIVTQRSHVESGHRTWASTVDVYYVADSPSLGVPPEKVALPPEPEHYEPLEGVIPFDLSPASYQAYRRKLLDRGLLGVSLINTFVLKSEQDIMQFYNDEAELQRRAEQRMETVERRWAQIATMDPLPDFVTFPGSGTLIWQTPEIFRKYCLPALQRGTELAKAAGVPSHMHSCGPERLLVEIMANETDLTIIDPLEIPPMGDCVLADLKQQFGDKIVLKGNLHTTDLMLRGSTQDVRDAARQAIDDAAEGGGFVLSTGDQCGRDTPLENFQAMVETARDYGRY